MKIEMVVPSLVVAGMEMVVANLVRGLSARGHEVGVTCIIEEGPVAHELQSEGHRVRVVAAPGLRTNLFPKRLAAWLRTVRPDVVHVHSGAWLKGVTAGRMSGAPALVYTLHGVYPSEPWYLPWLCRAAARRTHQGVAVSEALREYLVRTGLPRQHIAVVPNGIDTDRFAPAAAPGLLRRTLRVPEGGVLIGNVARFHPVKNHALLLDAFALLKSRVSGAVLVLAGDGYLRPSMERRAVDLGIAQDVRFLGLVPDPAQLYKELDVFVLSSVLEGTSISALEAMASGACVVATNVGGTPYLLKGGECGVLVDAGDAAALATALEQILRDPGRRLRLTTAARDWVASRYSIDTMVSGYEEIYNTLLSGYPREDRRFGPIPRWATGKA